MILLSHIINSETPTYGNRDKFISEEISCVSDGASANSSKWIFTSNHLGTHIDMPKHFFDEGLTLTDLPIDFWYSDKIQLIDIPCSKAKLIDIKDLNVEINMDTEVLLIRTGYEKYRKIEKYWNDNPGLNFSFGVWLRKNRPNVKIIGFDFISLTSWKLVNEGKKAHQVFLDPQDEGNPICIIEDMALYKINFKIKLIIVSPLFVKSANGGPVTVFAQF